MVASMVAKSSGPVIAAIAREFRRRRHPDPVAIGRIGHQGFLIDAADRRRVVAPRHRCGDGIALHRIDRQVMAELLRQMRRVDAEAQHDHIRRLPALVGHHRRDAVARRLESGDRRAELETDALRPSATRPCCARTCGNRRSRRRAHRALRRTVPCTGASAGSALATPSRSSVSMRQPLSDRMRDLAEAALSAASDR